MKADDVVVTTPGNKVADMPERTGLPPIGLPPIGMNLDYGPFSVNPENEMPEVIAPQGDD